MKVRLIQNVIENGGVKVSRRKGREDAVFVKGAIIDMSDPSAKKYIESKLAEIYVEPTKESQA